MIIEISTEDQMLLESLMQAGRFSSIEDAVHETLQRAMEEQPPTNDYLQYLDESIGEGLADADAGRTVSAEEFLTEVRSHQRTPGVAA